MFSYVFFIGIGVALSTLIGSVLAYFINDISHKANDAILAYAAGVMLGATVFNLVIPSIESVQVPGIKEIIITSVGILVGAFAINIVDKLVPHLQNVFHIDDSFAVKDIEKINKTILFVLAIAIHNFPEGLVVGISFGSNDVKSGIILALGIALQNIPEGLVTIFPLLNAGMDRKKAFKIAMITGLIELVGVIVGYLTVSISSVLSPFLLAFAGGTMLYVINHDMITETHAHGYKTAATYSLIVGFISMLVLNYILS